MLIEETRTILDHPLIRLGREVTGDLEAGLRREWLVTNALGGYASGTLAGPLTRRYHGLLVAALQPPVARTVLVAGAVEWATYQGQRYTLSAHEYGGGYVDGDGYRHLESFHLEGMLPVWQFAIGGALLERRVWMAEEANTTYVRYALLRGDGPLELEVTPLVTYRDFHSLSAGGWSMGVAPIAHGVALTAFEGARPVQLLAHGAAFRPGGDWYWNFHHREEAARGLDARSDLFAPGSFRGVVVPGAALTLVYSAEDAPDLDGERALRGARSRQAFWLRLADVESADPVLQQLVLAADQFIVARPDAADQPPVVARAVESAGRTVIAGYHWFNDWGRDTMISLPGLTLATGRDIEGAQILRTFARFVVDGLLPNNFPDQDGVIPGYNTVDATLWFVHAIRAHEQARRKRALVDELLPTVRAIAERHIAGTRYGIGMDPSDGLLRAGEPGVQLTWMDAKVGDYVVTPRIGKPVEINALWYNLLLKLAGWLEERGDAGATRYRELAARARASFQRRFWSETRGYLADLVDGPEGDDWTLRPNQIFAVSLPESPLDDEAARAVVATVGRSLLTSYGLRSLDPAHPAYRGDYGGDPYRRDTGYHQGPVWTWLLGPFVDAHLRVHGDRATARALLAPLADHLHDACLGSVSEILEGDPPHTPRGAVAQAWGVAELLRVWRLLADEERER